MFTAQTSDDARRFLASRLRKNELVVVIKQLVNIVVLSPDRRRDSKFGEMLVLYPALRKRRLQSLLRKAGLPRYCVCTHVDNHIDAANMRLKSIILAEKSECKGN